MSTVRIQLRRGTAAQWTSVHPVLAAGEVGFESDTRKMKVGDGTTDWTLLDYVSSDAPAIGEIAQDAINSALVAGTGLDKTYDDVANTITIDIDSTVATLTGIQTLTNKTLTTPTIGSFTNATHDHSNSAGGGGLASSAISTALGYTPADAADVSALATSVNTTTLGATTVNTVDLNATGDVVIDGNLTVNGDSTSLDTLNLLIKDNEIILNHGVTGAPSLSAYLRVNRGTSNKASIQWNETTDKWQISSNDTDFYPIATTTDLANHESDTTSVHGIADTSALATKTYADGAVSTHADDTSTHGISVAIVGTSETQTLTNKTFTLPKINENVVLSASSTELNILDGATLSTAELNILDGATLNTTELNILDGATLSTTELNYVEGVTSAIQTQIDSKAPIASPTFTGTVSGVTKTHVGLGNVDNTSDANKPVSTATQTALDLKSPIASPIFTGTVTLPLSTDGYVTTGSSGTISSVATIPNSGLTNSSITINGTSVSLGGTRTLSTTDISEGTGLYFTDERSQDAIGNNLGTGLSYNDSTGAISVNTSTIQARVSGVTDTEIGYLDGVTSAIQTQIDSKLESSTASTTYAPIASPTFTGTVSGVTKTHVGLGNVDNTSDANKPVSTATQTALDLKANLASPTFTGTVTLPSGTVTSSMIADSTIVNADISSSAAIALSKLATDPLARANHTGTQAASTISDFDTQVRTSKVTDLTAPTGSFSMNSQKITNLLTPTSDNDAANKAYVDAAVNGINIHESVVAATTGNVNLTNAVDNNKVLDGVTILTGNRILVKNQNTASQNGIYIVASNGAPTRATDYDLAGEVSAGDFIFVKGGTLNANTGWIQTSDVTTVGTDSLSFTQFSGAGTYTANTGLTLTGTVFSIDTATTVDKTTAQTLTNKTLTSPTLTTPALGVATATSINGTSIPSSATLITTSDTGTVTNTMLAGSIANNKLSNSTTTIGSTAISLGSSATTIAGLTSVTSTSFTGALTGNADTVTNGVYTTNLASGVLTFLGTPTSANLAAALTDETGSTSAPKVVFSNTPAITSPLISTKLSLYTNAYIEFEGSTLDANKTTLTVVDPTAARTITLPDATDTLVGKATTDTFTNKTFNTASTGNSLLVNSNAINAYTGTGSSVVLATSPSIATPTITGAITLSASGAAFTDGTQTKEGTPSRTPVNAKLVDYTAVATDRDSLLDFGGSVGQTITIPTNANVAFPIGTSIDVLQSGTGQVTVAGASGVTVNGTPGLKLRAQWSSCTLFKRATDSWVVMGDLTA